MPPLDKLESNGFAVSHESFLRDCPRCKNAIPLAGPVSQVRCPECLSAISISRTVWDGLFQRATMGWLLSSELDAPLAPVEIGEPQGRFKLETRQTLHAAPLCIHCGAPAPAESLSSSVDCAGCGKRIAYVPLERSFKGMLVTHVCATELDGVTANDGVPADTTPVELPEEAAPVAMACPLCSANLQVTADSPRTLACEYCGGSIFLPDALWRRFHPVKTVERWVTAHRVPARVFLAEAKLIALWLPLALVINLVVFGGAAVAFGLVKDGVNILGDELAVILGGALVLVIVLFGLCFLRARRFFAAARRFG